MTRLFPSVLLLATLAACTRPGPDVSALRYTNEGSILNDPELIPREDLPGKKLERNFHRFEELQLLGRDLKVNESSELWSSSYFPTWYGGIAGRWQDNLLLLGLRSILGQSLLPEEEARAALRDTPERINGFAPTEKYDLAVGDYEFHSTAFESRERGHNTPSIYNTTPFWSGYCNGIAEAAIRHREPFREVEVLNPDGHKVRFHPNDIKALLGLAYVRSGEGIWVVGTRCNFLNTSNEACMDVNAGTFVLTLLNRLGIARSSFMVDKDPLLPVINVPISDGRVDILRPPYEPPPGTRAARLVDVRITLGASSTQLGYSDANHPGEAQASYKKVGLRREQLTYSASLALDAKGNIIGGAWIAPEMHGPDIAWGLHPSSAGVLQTRQHLWYNAFIRWDMIRKLYEKSISDEPGIPLLDFGTLLDKDEIFAFFKKSTEVKRRQGAPAFLYAYLTESLLKELDMIVVHAGSPVKDSSQDVYVASYKLTDEQRKQRRLIIEIPVEIPPQGTPFLKARLFRRSETGEPQPWRDITTFLYPRPDTLSGP